MSQKWKSETVFNARMGKSDGLWGRIFIRPMFFYKFPKKWIIGAGLYGSATDFESEAGQFEIRPTQELRGVFPYIKRIQFQHRIRFEERYIGFFDSQDPSVTFRVRYRLQLMIPLNRKNMVSDTWYAKGASELLVENDRAALEEKRPVSLRVALTSGYKLTERWEFELRYTLQQKRNEFDIEERENTHVLLLSIRQKLF